MCYLFSERVIFHESHEITRQIANFTNYAILSQFREIAESLNSTSPVKYRKLMDSLLEASNMGTKPTLVAGITP